MGCAQGVGMSAVGLGRVKTLRPDGTIDVWFGPTLPKDAPEVNWAQTILGKGWNMLFRLYGLLEPWFDKSWRVGGVELVK